MWNASPASLADPLQLGRKDALDLRSALLRVLTDLYLQQPVHTPEDESYYTELALRLLDAVDVSERAALAARLARYSSAPRALLDRLARDVIQVARPILDHPRWIGPAGGKSAAQAPTSPAGPPPTGTSHSPTESEAYALWQLFFAASSVERRLILVNLDYAVLIPMASLSSAACAEIWRWASVIPQPRIEAAAHELETALGVSRMQLRRILDDERGEPMVVVAKAINLPAKLLVRWLEQRDCSTSMIHASGSNFSSRARRSSTLASGAGCSLRHRLKSRSAGRASSKALCGAGPNSSAVPSRRLSLTKIAPASSAPRRRTAAKAPSAWQRRI